MRDWRESKEDIKNRIYLLSVEIKEMQKEMVSFRDKQDDAIYGLINNKLLYNQLKKIDIAAK